MMKVALLTLLSGALVLGGPANAKSKVKHPAHNKKVALVCPVTGDKIASKEKAVGHSTYKGKTYYFCCAGCKPEFDKDPAKYTMKKADKPAKTDQPG